MFKRKDLSQIEWEFYILMMLKPNGSCLEWQGYVEPKGYGSVTRKKKPLRIHRCVYEIVKGKIPKGLVLDHLCRNKICCNPDHLEPVTNGINVLRGEGLAAAMLKRKACKNGHVFDKKNTYFEPGVKARRCRTCKRINTANKRLRDKNER